MPAYRYFLILFSRYATASPKGKPLILFAFGVRLAARSFVGRAGSSSQDDGLFFIVMLSGACAAEKPSPFKEGGPLAVDEDK